MYLPPEFGFTYRQLEKDGFKGSRKNNNLRNLRIGIYEMTA